MDPRLNLLRSKDGYIVGVFVEFMGDQRWVLLRSCTEILLFRGSGPIKGLIVFERPWGRLRVYSSGSTWIKLQVGTKY